MGICEALSCLEMGFVPFSFLWTTQNSRALPPLQPWCVWVQFEALPVAVRCRILPVCCWDAFPAAFCLLSDPSRPGFVLVVPLLPGLGWAAPASSLWDYAPQLKAGLFLVLGSAGLFLEHGTSMGREGEDASFALAQRK